MGQRRSISVRSDTYDRLRLYCGKNGWTASGLIEKLISEALGAVHTEVSEVPEISTELLEANKIFTF